MSRPRSLRRRCAIPVPAQCRDLIERGALVAVNSSGGKDSQCMTILLSRIVPLEQLLIVHAPLGEVEWPGTVNFIESTIPARVPFILAPIASGKSLLETVEQRGRWPSPKARYCTAGHKRGPIERELRRHLRAHPRFEGRLVNAMGLRRDESRERAKRTPWRRNERMSLAGREVYDWLPVFDLTTEDVFRVIDEDGQSPHPVYSLGLGRCSCSFCIFGSRSDLRRAAELRPDLYVTRPSNNTLATRSRLRVCPCPQSPGFPCNPPPHPHRRTPRPVTRAGPAARRLTRAAAVRRTVQIPMPRGFPGDAASSRGTPASSVSSRAR